MKTFLGIDVGVKNAGWALTDENYNVVSIKGCKAMGVLSFDEGSTAENRRLFRRARIRFERRSYRVDLLQELFESEIMKIDANFLRRLDENDLWLSDRGISGKYSLFNDEKFTDVQYYKKFPTIYHLRKHLMENSIDDIRLLYLVVHHIVKYRGHFLQEGEVSDFKGTGSVKTIFERVNEIISERTADEEFDKKALKPFDLSRLDEVRDIVSGIGSATEEALKKVNETLEYKKSFLTKRDKIDAVSELLSAKTTAQKEVVKALFGNKFNITTVLGAEFYPKTEVRGFYFSDEWDGIEDLSLLADNVEEYELVSKLKELYDWVFLNGILKGKSSISSAMVAIYDEHKADLAELKKFIRMYAPSDYDKVFGGEYDEKVNNYTGYIGGGRLGKNKLGNNGRIGKVVAKDDFYKFIKEIIETVAEESELKTRILTRIENKDFMPKINSTNNSALPYQLGQLELVAILTRASESGKFDFLQREEDGWSVGDKIVSLLTFRRPYFVGHVKVYKGDELSKNTWSVRKKEGRVTPWTFKDLIDEEKSNTGFIQKMTNTCTYLKKAKTLPKNSLLFSKFCCLNELNKIKINGELMSVEIKKAVFESVYLCEKPSIKKIKTFLINNFHYDKNVVLSGVDDELKSNMNSYLVFKKALGEKADKNPSMIERIIFLATIHTESRMLEKSIREEFRDLEDREIKAIKGFTFNGWGSLSAELLAGYKNKGIKIVYEGEFIDIIDIMFETNMNLQEILNSSKCNFTQALDDYNVENGVTDKGFVTYEDLEEMYCSPSVRRSVWQTFKLVQDIVKQTKTTPDRIFLESTRENSDKLKKKKSKTRKEQIEEAYKTAKAQSNELAEEIAKCNKELANYSNTELNKEKLFLYFMQLGKCLYTQKTIEINKLFNDNYYDVDHIIPKSTHYDDSFTNKVLVCQDANKIKADKYPLAEGLKQPEYWLKLKKVGLLSDEKYSRLIRTTPFSKEEQEKFINRQLVETNQSVTILKELLQKHYYSQDNADRIVLSKAGNVSMFRKEFSLAKSRDVNDFHHAADAYLNIVVGNILNKEYNHNWNFASRDNGIDKSYNFLKTLQRNANSNQGALLSLLRAELDTKDFRVVKKVEIKKGELYKARVFPAEAKAKSALIAQCESKIVDGVETNPKSDTTKYGGYKSSGTAYFVVVDSAGKKGTLKRTIEDISVLDDARIKNGKTTISEVLKNAGLKQAKLAQITGLKNSVIKAGSLFECFDGRLRLVGISGGRLVLNNANQLFVSSEQNRYIKEIDVIINKANNAVKLEKGDKEKVLFETTLSLIEENKRRLSLPNQKSDIAILSAEENIRLYDFFISKLQHKPYKNIPAYSSLLIALEILREDFESKNIYTQIVVLKNILCAFQCNPLKVDVSSLSYVDENGEEKKAMSNGCNITRGKEIKDGRDFVLVCQSKSGLKERRINLGL